MAKKSKLWGAVAETVATPVAIVAGTVAGGVNAVTGHGGFGEGFENTANDISDSAREFGEDHGSAFTDGLVRGAGSSLSSRAVNHGKGE